MKIMHLEILTSVLLLVLAYIALSLFKYFLTAGLRRSETSRAASVGSRLAALWRNSIARLRKNAGSNASESVRVRQLRPISDHENGSVAGEDREAEDFKAHVETRLESAFELFSRGRISIVTFRNLAQIEADSTREQIAEVLDFMPDRPDRKCDSPGANPDMAEALRLAEICVNWADEMIQQLGAHSSGEKADGYTERRVQSA